eukprot:7662954-Alexandrium_andersonii.AAC.1
MEHSWYATSETQRSELKPKHTTQRMTHTHTHAQPTIHQNTTTISVSGHRRNDQLSKPHQLTALTARTDQGT